MKRRRSPPIAPAPPPAPPTASRLPAEYRIAHLEERIAGLNAHLDAKDELRKASIGLAIDKLQALKRRLLALQPIKHIDPKLP